MTEPTGNGTHTRGFDRKWLGKIWIGGKQNGLAWEEDTILSESMNAGGIKPCQSLTLGVKKRGRWLFSNLSASPLTQCLQLSLTLMTISIACSSHNSRSKWVSGRPIPEEGGHLSLGMLHDPVLPYIESHCTPPDNLAPAGCHRATRVAIEVLAVGTEEVLIAFWNITR